MVQLKEFNWIKNDFMDFNLKSVMLMSRLIFGIGFALLTS